MLLSSVVNAELRSDQNFKYWQMFDTGTQSLRAIHKTPNSEWQPIPNGVTDTNFLDQAYWLASQGETLWIKIELPRRIESERLWIELIPNVGLDGQLAIFDEDHWEWKLPIGRQTSENSKLPTTFLSFVLDQPRNHRIVYLKLHTSQVFHFSINIKENDAYLKHMVSSTLFNGLVFGLLILAIIYNMAIGISAGEKLYLYYAFYVLCILLYLIAMTGYLRFAFPDWGGNGSFSNLSVMLAIFAGILFVRELLDTPNTAPKIDLVLRAQKIALFFSIFLIGFASDLVAFCLAEALGATAPLVVFAAGIAAWRKGHPLARHFLVAWSLFLVSMVVWAWMWLGLIEPTLPTLRFFLMGIVAEVMLLSLVLGFRYSELKKQTEALYADKTRHQDLSETDSLTGVFNRPGLFSKIEKMLSSSNHELIWIEINIDEFKRLNEKHGHHLCDKLLFEFGQILKTKVRRDNLAAKLIDKENSFSYRRGVAGRVGGGEFTVLLSNCSLPQARLYAERLIRDYENIKIKSQQSGPIHSSISIGLIQVAPKADIHSSWLSANKMLNKAKAIGHGQLAMP